MFEHLWKPPGVYGRMWSRNPVLQFPLRDGRSDTEVPFAPIKLVGMAEPAPPPPAVIILIISDDDNNDDNNDINTTANNYISNKDHMNTCIHNTSYYY